VRLALRDRPGLAALLAATAVAAAFGIAADGARVLVLAWAPGLDGWDFPPPDSRLLHAVDLLVGLSLVAATEELAFRAPLLLAARERRVARLPALAANAVLFGLIHWSQGLDNVASGALSGLAFGVSALATGSLWPALLAHYLVDLWHFA
jgi:membrane protease YdiL (CAAX protease family)